MTKEVLTLPSFKNYLQNNISPNKKILLSISCGLDSTVLFDLINKSKYFNDKNIHYLIFDHQKRSEGKYEINQFIKFYKIINKNIFIKKLSINNKLKGFQEKSRFSRYDFLYKYSKKRNIEDIFLGHHLDDLNETFLLRKIQQSGTSGLSNIFSNMYKGIKLHRPLSKYSKKQIEKYANVKKLIWFEDRSNLELDYTRNKIRYFLSVNKLWSKINKERLLFSDIYITKSLHQNIFKKKQNKIFYIDLKKFNKLNENLKFIIIQSFYFEHRNIFKRQIRDENIRNFIKILRNNFKKGEERSVFSGKIGVFNKKICLNLT